jgi:hypothetical protein
MNIFYTVIQFDFSKVVTIRDSIANINLKQYSIRIVCKCYDFCNCAAIYILPQCLPRKINVLIIATEENYFLHFKGNVLPSTERKNVENIGCSTEV